MSKTDGMNYAPEAKSKCVCEKGEFRFGVIGLDHGHIFGMTKGLLGAGGELVWVYDRDSQKVKSFKETFPDVKVAETNTQIFEDSSLHMIASAAIPSVRCSIGLSAMDHGKHYMSDKPPFTNFEQLEKARQKIKETGLVWAVCYSERLTNEASVFAGQLIEEGAIGRVIQVMGLGPHRLNKENRPEWFFQREHYGGILCDIGSHQIEQFLYFGKVESAEVLHSKVGNYNNPDVPELEDYGDATLVGNNGVTNYFRVDWFTPDGLGTWGDGRMTILGTKGTIELRKYVDIAREANENNVYLVDQVGEHYFNVDGKVGFPYFGDLILDCLNRTENAMPQKHTFLAAQLCLEAQQKAIRVC